MRLENLEGETLSGRFRLVKLLGQGGYGAVFEAEQLSVGRRCAVKVLFPHLCEDEATVERFRSEARTTSQLSHPNSIILYDFGRDEERELLFLAMELLDGRDLSSWIDERGTLEVAQAVHIVRQAAESLHEAHQLGLVHRDVKPQNIMLIERGNDPLFVKVIDFGIAKVVSHHLLTANSLTRTGNVIGTPKYMSPEQICDEQMDGRADMYALAVTVYRMLTGRTLFESGTALEIAGRQVNERPKPIRAFRPDLPISDAFESVVMRALAKDPDDRFDDVAAFARALDDATSTAERPRVGPRPSPSEVSVRCGGQRLETQGARPSARGERAPATTETSEQLVEQPAVTPAPISSPGPRRQPVSVGLIRPDEYTFEETPSVERGLDGSEDGQDELFPEMEYDEVTLATLAIPNPARPDAATGESPPDSAEEASTTRKDPSVPTEDAVREVREPVQGRIVKAALARVGGLIEALRRRRRLSMVAALGMLSALLIGGGVWYAADAIPDDSKEEVDRGQTEDGVAADEGNKRDERGDTVATVDSDKPGNNESDNESQEAAKTLEPEDVRASAEALGRAVAAGQKRARERGRDLAEKRAKAREDDEAEREADDKTSEKPAAPATYRVEVRVIPWGTLYIDGREIADGRRQHVRVTEGRHRFELKQQGEVRDTQTVDVTAGSSKIVELVAQ